MFKGLFGGKTIKLHIGSGPVAKRGWINIDNVAYAGVDQVLDVTQGLPYSEVDLIFAEHFIEHLSYDHGVAFLKECRRALKPSGILRLSTPNLDWVWMTQYHLGQWTQPSEAVRDCFWINKGFRGWGHQFLYNAQTLTETLRSAGFATVTMSRYGESANPELRALEEHEKYPDTPDLPHVIVAEATGVATAGVTATLTGPLADYNEAINAR